MKHHWKRWLAVAAIVALASVAALADTTYGPDSYGYQATNGVTFNYNNITSTGTRLIGACDDCVAGSNIGFNFNFYGNNYSSVTISNNGTISFGTGTSYGNYDLTSTNTSPLIAAFWDDLYNSYSTPNTGVYVQTSGTAGSRRFTVQYYLDGFYYNTAPGTADFEVTLFEGSNNILLQYNALTFSGDAGRNTGSSATIGITSGNYSSGNVLQWSYNTANSVSPGEAILFTTGQFPTSTPEPAGLMLLGSGLLGMCSLFRKRR